MKGETDKSVDALNGFLRGEISAVETYRQAIEKLSGSPARGQLEDCQRSHEIPVELALVLANGPVPGRDVNDRDLEIPYLQLMKSLQILRIDAKGLVILGYRLAIISLQEEHAPHLVPVHAVIGVTGCGQCELFKRGGDIAFRRFRCG